MFETLFNQTRILAPRRTTRCAFYTFGEAFLKRLVVVLKKMQKMYFLKNIYVLKKNTMTSFLRFQNTLPN